LQGEVCRKSRNPSGATVHFDANGDVVGIEVFNVSNLGAQSLAALTDAAGE
jgi:uncharacterized protein YuzE